MAGELDFEAALRQRVALLAGMSCEALEAAAAHMTLNPGARTLVATMQASGAYCALLSGGFTCFTEPISAACGFDDHRARNVVVWGKRLSVRVTLAGTRL